MLQALGAIAGAVGSGLMEDSIKKGQTEWNKEQQLDLMRKAPMAQMQGYRDAGLNPMLAATQGVTFPTISQGSGITSPASSYGQIQSAAAAMKQADTTASVAPSTIDLNTASARKAAADTSVSVETVEKVKAEVANARTENDRLKALIDVLHEQRQNLIKEGWNLTEVGNKLRSEVSKIRAEVPLVNQMLSNKMITYELDKLVLDAQKAFDNFGNEYKQYAPIIDLLKSVIFINRTRGD